MEGWRSKRRLPPRLTSSAAATQVALACASAAEAVSAFLARLAPYRALSEVSMQELELYHGTTIDTKQ